MLYFYNSLSRQKELFTPLDPSSIRMYVCGPTVYNFPHIGNARSIIVYDLLYRLLCHHYGADKVVYIRNITDVDDKINLEAKRRGISIQALTDEVIEGFHKDIRALNCLAPNYEPKATEHIGDIIAMIERLLAEGYAYTANGHVYFATERDKNYAQLAGRQLDEMIAGSRVEIDDNKRHPADFVLWKPVSKDDDISSIFQSPWGEGRPGWHIECSAMSCKYLGQDFDIHGGGADLIFPHHSNEIAQSCGANPGSQFARFWIHNGFVTVGGHKMSKSLGNFIVLRDLLEEGIDPMVIRFALMHSHYHKPLDWHENIIEQSQKTLLHWSEILSSGDIVESEPEQEFVEILSNNMNVPASIAYLHNMSSKNLGKFKANLALLGLDLPISLKAKKLPISEEEIEKIITKRREAKANKDYDLADKLRHELAEKGVILEDKAGGITDWRII